MLLLPVPDFGAAIYNKIFCQMIVKSTAGFTRLSSGICMLISKNAEINKVYKFGTLINSLKNKPS